MEHATVARSGRLETRLTLNLAKKIASCGIEFARLHGA
jgi:hypothetical protein